MQRNRRTMFGEPDRVVDTIELSANHISIECVGDDAPIFREGLDWSTIVGDKRAAGFLGHVAVARDDDETVAEGRVASVSPLVNRSGLRLDAIADPAIVDTQLKD